jgi:hypothetical protein
LLVSRDQLNDDAIANGVASFLVTGAGWVIWGNRTAGYPGTTDIKDAMVSVRAMYNYIRNNFLDAMSGRVSLPLNTRQIDGILKSYNFSLNAFVGVGAMASGEIILDDDLNTTAGLLDGKVYFKILISPPIQSITGTVEYGVESFVVSIKGG